MNDINAKELIRREKERRRLEREQKKKTQQKDNVLGNSLDCSSLKLNLETEDKHLSNELIDTIKNNHLNEYILNKSIIKEPIAPTNKQSCIRNLKGEFEKYTKNVENIIQHEKNENDFTNVKRQKKCSTNVQWSDDLLNNFEENSKEEKRLFVENKKKKINATDDKIVKIENPKHEKEITEKKNIIYNKEDKHKQVKEEKEENKVPMVEEIYEIIEPDDISEPLIENEEFLKIKKNRQQKNNEDENMKYIKERESDKVEELNKYPLNNIEGIKLNKEVNKDRNKIKNESENTNLNITKNMTKEKEYFHWIDNCLHEVEKYAPDELAYFKEIDYLLHMLKEKKKKLLGNLHDEEKENKKREKQKQNMTEEDFVEIIDEFHMNVKTEKNKKTENQNEIQINFDEIYKLLEIEKKEDTLSGYLETEQEYNQEDQVGSEDISEKNKNKTEVEKLPKGFFDDQEEKAYIKKKRDIFKINEKIKLLEMEKEKILQEYNNVDEVYEKKMNSYIDYLCEDDKNYDKTDILYKVKQKHTNVENNSKGEHRLWIKSIFEEEKRKETKRKETKRKETKRKETKLKERKQELQEYLSTLKTTIPF